MPELVRKFEPAPERGEFSIEDREKLVREIAVEILQSFLGKQEDSTDESTLMDIISDLIEDKKQVLKFNLSEDEIATLSTDIFFLIKVNNQELLEEIQKSKNIVSIEQIVDPDDRTQVAKLINNIVSYGLNPNSGNKEKAATSIEKLEEMGLPAVLIRQTVSNLISSFRSKQEELTHNSNDGSVIYLWQEKKDLLSRVEVAEVLLDSMLNTSKELEVVNSESFEISQERQLEFVTGNFEFRDLEQMLKIFELKEIDYGSFEEPVPSLFDPKHREEAFKILEEILTRYLITNPKVASLLGEVPEKFIGPFNRHRIVKKLMDFIKEKFSRKIVNDEIFTGFLSQKSLSNNQKFIVLISYILHNLLKKNKEYKKYRKSMLDNFDISKYKIQPETFGLLEDKFSFQNRLKGMQLLIEEFFYGYGKYNGELSILLDAHDLTYNKYYLDKNGGHALDSVLRQMTIDLKKDLKINLTGRGVDKATKILKAFIERYVIIDVRNLK